MARKDSKLVEQIVDALRGVPPALRQERLDALCEQVPQEIRQEAERILQREVHAETTDRPAPMPDDCFDRTIDTKPVSGDGDSTRDSWQRSDVPAPSSFDDGRYRVKSQLGEGGQKCVFLVHDTYLEREAVVAVLSRQSLGTDGLHRVRDEARAMARLDEHPNVASIYDIGEENGNPFLVTQYVRGGSVADLLSARHPNPLEIKQALRIASQTCHALAHAHSHGILHRDVKPGNVWLMQDGTVKLGDFGLALSLEQTQLGGAMVGTAAYMSPEQAKGQRVGPASDLYALGVMLFEMAVGRRPFEGDSWLAVLSQHVNVTPVAPSWHNPAIDPRLDQLILSLLSKSPDDRPGTATRVAELLDEISQSEAPSVPLTQREAKSLDRLASGVFVGRQDELESLRAGLDSAVSGAGSLYLVSGEPGSGKTRLTEELATYAQMRGAEVLVAKCFDGEGAPAFWPWVQILRTFVKTRAQDQLVANMGPGAADIAQLDSEIRLALPDLPAPPPMDPEQSRFRLFDSITNFFCNAGSEHPLLLVIDDLQWADEPSLRLIQFLAREVARARVLIVGTHRDVALGRRHGLTRAIGELTREDLVQRIQLSGLTLEDVGRYVEMSAAVRVPDSFVSQIWAKTEGNPFFVNEICRLLVTEGHFDDLEHLNAIDISIPQEVRDVVGRRLEQLSETCNDTLLMASVIGREFGLDVLRRLIDVDEDEIIDNLDEAIAARVLAEADGAEFRFTFTHDLIRESLCAELTKVRRMRLHNRIAAVLEEIYAGRTAAHAAEIASHFVAAGHAGDPAKAIHYSIQAGDRAFELLAYEEAVRYYGAAIELEPDVTEDGSRICQLLHSLAESHRRAGELQPALDTYQRLAQAARDAHLPGELAQAATGVVETNWALRLPTPGDVLLCDEALEVLPEHETNVRVHLLSAKAKTLRYLGSGDAAARTVQDAVELARQLAEPPALSFALDSLLHVISGPENVGQRLTYANEMVHAVQASGNPEQLVQSRIWKMFSLLEIGDTEAAKEALTEAEVVAKRIRMPFFLYLLAGFGGMQATLDGDFVKAERLAREALTIGKRVRAENVEGAFGVQMFTLRREQNRLQEIAPFVQMFVRENPNSSWRPGLALIYAELGRTESAREVFEELAAEGFEQIAKDGMWVTSMSFLTEVCTYLEDQDRCRTLFRLLEPHAGYAMTAAGAAACYGAASRFLGMLSSTLEEWTVAEELFNDAIEFNSKMRAIPWLNHARYQYAQMLAKRRGDGDLSKANSLLTQASDSIGAHGMELLRLQIQQLRTLIDV